MLYHGLSQLGLPIFCIESRQAHQALKSLVTHKTDRNDARGLAHLAGFTATRAASLLATTSSRPSTTGSPRASTHKT